MHTRGTCGLRVYALQLIWNSTWTRNNRETSKYINKKIFYQLKQWSLTFQIYSVTCAWAQLWYSYTDILTSDDQNEVDFDNGWRKIGKKCSLPPESIVTALLSKCSYWYFYLWRCLHIRSDSLIFSYIQLSGLGMEVSKYVRLFTLQSISQLALAFIPKSEFLTLCSSWNYIHFWKHALAIIQYNYLYLQKSF